jgi:carotenoid 1,2-hydratase
MNRIELPSRSGAYRWYYVDVSAGDYTAVFIFMIGSIFSAKYSTSLKKGGLPREHAAVNFALYEKGVRWQWVLTEYAEVKVSPDSRRLNIGDSWLQYDDGRLTAEIKDKTTPFMMTGWGAPTKVSLDFRPDGPSHPEVELVPGLSHRWRPIAARGQATVRLENQGLELHGRGYHDGNHGDVPLGSDLRGWDWIRVHRPEATEITYRPWASTPATVVRVTPDVAMSRPAVLEDSQTTRTNWGLRVPRALGLPGEPALLESSPFYARAETASGGSHALGEVADFRRFHSPSVRWMANFKTRNGSAA